MIYEPNSALQKVCLQLCNRWQVVEEREPDGGAWEARRQFIYGGTYIDEPLIFDKDTDSDGDCVDAGGSSRFFYAQGANFNVVAVTASDGTVVETVTYDPYGEATVTVAGGQSASANPYLFQGRRWDSEADLYYFRNRALSPRLGRFVQRDPIGYVDGLNNYEYAANAPCVLLDPSGRYKIVWKGLAWNKWHPHHKHAVRFSIRRVRKRLDVLIKEGNATLKRLRKKPRCYAPLIHNLEHLMTVLKNVREHIQSKDYKINFRRKDLGPNQSGEHKSGWPRNTVILNTNRKNNWFRKKMKDQNSTMLHELSHEEGTEDDKAKTDWNNAHVIDDLIHTRIQGLPRYKLEKSWCERGQQRKIKRQ